MFFKSFSAGTEGINGYIVEVEVDIITGIPGLTMVGLPNGSVREAKDRIKSAIGNSGFKYPNKKIVVNLSPADIKKEGSHYDLSIAVSILMDSQLIDEKHLKDTGFLGELALNGDLKPVKGCTALLLGLAKEKKVKKVIIPWENRNEASMVPDIDVFLGKNLKEVCFYLKNEGVLESLSNIDLNYKIPEIEDFKDVKGSFIVKRGMEIAAAGFHNVFMIGPPGSGKTMIASRLNTIMSDLDDKEYMEVSQIYSFLGEIPDNIIARKRPFRAPHHTVTYSSLIGGGYSSTPGEVVLSHNGILFMDEFLEFNKKIVEGLRQPLEDKKITISRVNKKITYPSDFILIGSSNPCPCGNYKNPLKECLCSENKIKAYLNRASGPMLDRIDVFLETTPLAYDEISSKSDEESSLSIRDRVMKAVDFQRQRFKDENINYNSQMSIRHIEKYCNLTKDAESFLKSAFKKTGLSARSYHRVLRVSRTIADLDSSQDIKLNHIGEALSFRKTFMKYWG